jgi:glycine betaine/choline ABC-type transport system substrate-binding protein
LRSPQVRAALEALAGGISEREMRALNYDVDVGHRDVAVAVREFLRRGGQLYSPADTSGKNGEPRAKS